MNIPTDLRGEFERKIRRGIFNPIARFLPEDVREDRLQDAIAQPWAITSLHGSPNCRVRIAKCSSCAQPAMGWRRSPRG